MSNRATDRRLEQTEKPDPVAEVMNDFIRQGGKRNPQIERLLERLRKSSLESKRGEKTDEHQDRGRA
mgnify:CR=1 FL=1